MPPLRPHFGAIYREHFGYVWSLLRRHGVDPVDLDDLAQDVFVGVHRQLHRFEARSSVRTWLHTITVRVARHHLRRRGARSCLVELLEQADELAATGPDPEHAAACKQARALIEGLIARLDEDKRAVFVLAELEGLRVPEIAAKLGVNLHTVYSRLQAARTKFRDDMGRVRARDRGTRRANEAAAKQRVWAALALRLGEPAGLASVASIGAVGLVQSTAVAVGLAAAVLGAIHGLGGTAPDPIDGSSAIAAGGSRSESRWPPEPPATPGAVAGPETIPVPAIAIPTAQPAAPPRPPPSPPSKRRASTRARATNGEVVPSDDSVADELFLMARARAAIRDDDANGALVLLDEHGRRFPAGHLAPERERWLAVARRALASRATPEGT